MEESPAAPEGRVESLRSTSLRSKSLPRSPTKTIRPKGCGCKKGCKHGCSCRTKKKHCGPSCGCGDECTNKMFLPCSCTRCGADCSCRKGKFHCQESCACRYSACSNTAIQEHMAKVRAKGLDFERIDEGDEPDEDAMLVNQTFGVNDVRSRFYLMLVPRAEAMECCLVAPMTPRAQTSCGRRAPAWEIAARRVAAKRSDRCARVVARAARSARTSMMRGGALMWPKFSPARAY